MFLPPPKFPGGPQPVAFSSSGVSWYATRFPWRLGGGTVTFVDLIGHR